MSRKPHPLVRELHLVRLRAQVERTELGERIGYSHRTIGAWECGRATPSLAALCDLAEALGYTLTLVERSPS